MTGSVSLLSFVLVALLAVCRGSTENDLSNYFNDDEASAYIDEFDANTYYNYDDNDNYDENDNDDDEELFRRLKRTASRIWNRAKRTVTNVARTVGNAVGICGSSYNNPRSSKYSLTVANRLLDISIASYCSWDIEDDTSKTYFSSMASIASQTDECTLCKTRLKSNIYNVKLAEYCDKGWNIGNRCGELMMLYDSKLRGIVIAFAGSKTFGDFLAALDSSQQNWDGKGKVFNAYRKWFNGLKSTVASYVATELRKRRYAKIFVTGHSAGAAVGALTAAYLADKKGYRSRVWYYGFGSPKVGNSAFESYFLKTLGWQGYNVINKVDAATFYVDVAWYKRTPHVVWYKNGGTRNPRVCDNKPNNCCRPIYGIAGKWSDHYTYFGKSMKKEACGLD